MKQITLCKTKAGKGFKIVVDGVWYYTSKGEIKRLLNGSASGTTFRVIEEGYPSSLCKYEHDLSFEKDVGFDGCITCEKIESDARIDYNFLTNEEREEVDNYYEIKRVLRWSLNYNKTDYNLIERIVGADKKEETLMKAMNYD